MPEPDLAHQCAAALPGWILYAIGALFPAALAGLVSHVNAWIRQPAAGSLWLLVRKPLSLLGGSYGFAKDADQETLPEWWEANSSAFLQWLVGKASDAVLTEVAKRIQAQQVTAAAAATPIPEQPPLEGGQ